MAPYQPRRSARLPPKALEPSNLDHRITKPTVSRNTKRAAPQQSLPAALTKTTQQNISNHVSYAHLPLEIKELIMKHAVEATYQAATKSWYNSPRDMNTMFGDTVRSLRSVLSTSPSGGAELKRALKPLRSNIDEDIKAAEERLGTRTKSIAQYPEAKQIAIVHEALTSRDALLRQVLGISERAWKVLQLRKAMKVEAGRLLRSMKFVG